MRINWNWLLGLAIVLWTGTMGLVLSARIVGVNRFVDDTVINQAQTITNKDMAFRNWGTAHGGVYVPPTETTIPNPYLSHIPDRDITTTTGRQLMLNIPWAYKLAWFPGVVLIYHGLSFWFWAGNQNKLGYHINTNKFRITWVAANIVTGVLTILVIW